MPRPQLLFLAHLLPYPPDSGAAIRTFNVLKLLAERFDVTALCFYRLDPARDPNLENRLATLRTLARVEAFPIPQQRSRLRLLWDHLRSLLTFRPYTYYMHDSSAFRRALHRELRRGDTQLIHLDSLDLVRYLADLPSGVPTVCTHHNVESQLMRRRAAGEKGFLGRVYMRVQAQYLEAAERGWLGRFTLNVAVSEADAVEFSRLAPKARIVTIPNGVDTDFFTPMEGPTGGCVFVGGLDWFPNLDALDWFQASVLPALREMGMVEPVTWVGTAPNGKKGDDSGGVHLTGYVEDIRPYMARASCFIVPLRIGGGTRLKILNAWAMGKAVVSTSIGAEGLKTQPGENILLADTAGEFAQAVSQVLSDEALQRRMGNAGRRTVNENYSWAHLGRQLHSFYEDLLSRSGPGVAIR